MPGGEARSGFRARLGDEERLRYRADVRGDGAGDAVAQRDIAQVVAGFAVFGQVHAVGFGSVGGIILAVVGAVMLVTAAVGFCPLYRVFGISTCKVPQTR